MKKWTFVCMTVLLCGMLTLSAGAAETNALPDGHFATASELFQYWNDGGLPSYPDYVGGVWTDNGTDYPLTFAVTDDAAGKAGKQEILRLIADDASVKFVKVKHSYDLLWQIRNEIEPYFEQKIGLVGLGVYDMENCVGLEIHKDYRDVAATQELVQNLMARYGDAVRISYTDGYVAMTTLQEVDPIRDAASPTASAGIAVIGAAILGTAALVLTLRHRKHALAAQTAAGTVTVGATRTPTRRAVKKALRESGETPPTALEDRVMDQIDWK